MVILCVIDSLGSGGAQRQLVNLAIAFKEKGHRVSFLTYHHEDFYVGTLKDLEIDYTCIQEYNYFTRIFKMRSFIRNQKVDAVLSFLEAANFICQFAGFPSRKWRLVVGERSSNPNIFKSIKLRFYRWMHLFSDFVVANSHENIKMVRAINPFLSEYKCKVIYNMVDFNIWKPADNYTLLKAGKLTVVVAASHQYLKNLPLLVKSVSKLTNEKKENIQIDWYGNNNGLDNSFSDSQALIKKYHLEEIFKFYPATLTILEKMQQADVVGLFSNREGLPNAVCEGMAIGKPIIATNVSDVHILLSSQNGVLCEVNVDSIAHGLSRLMDCSSEELKEMGEKSRSSALDLFDRNRIVDSYLKLMS